MSNELQSQIDDIRATLQQAAQIQVENQRSISDLRSTVSTLADIGGTHERLHEETRQRLDQFVERADADRALMLQLIQSIAQGGNGGAGR